MRWRSMITVTAAGLAVSGMLAMAPVAANSAIIPTWTEQQPATSPPALQSSTNLMAYDAATGNVVLFDDNGDLNGGLGVTWTWDGTTWTQQHPATSPPILSGGQENAAMAYDAATGSVVLFGGQLSSDRVPSNSTWTWDGSTWTQQHPATHPPAQVNALMAYDAATGNVVLFGGQDAFGHVFGGTWTWDGTTWTQHPGAHPRVLIGAAMAYDAATGNVVLFGAGNHPRQSWTWDGTTWTQQHPATSPPARRDEKMAYDAATGNVVLFGGYKSLTAVETPDTWTWDGTTWTQQHPATHPRGRRLAQMAYDGATSNVVMFSGSNTNRGFLDDTWTWG